MVHTSQSLDFINSLPFSLQQSDGRQSLQVRLYPIWHITARTVFHDLGSVNGAGMIVPLAKHLKLLAVVLDANLILNQHT